MYSDGSALTQLRRDECLKLMASVPVGRVIYTRRALPAVEPVNFALDHGDIVLRTDRSGKLAYEGAMNEDIYDNRPDGADHVRAALDDLMAGRPVKLPQTQPQGCAIEY